MRKQNGKTAPEQDRAIQLMGKGYWSTRKVPQNQTECRQSLGNQVLLHFPDLWRVTSMLPQGYDDVSIERIQKQLSVESHQFKGSSEQGRAAHSQQPGREMGMPGAGHTCSLREPYRESNESCRHPNDHSVMKKFKKSDCNFLRVGKPLGHCLRSGTDGSKQVVELLCLSFL